jgi:hypothetical protein
VRLLVRQTYFQKERVRGEFDVDVGYSKALLECMLQQVVGKAPDIGESS